jgi:toxin ParE1/3/4
VAVEYIPAVQDNTSAQVQDLTPSIHERGSIPNELVTVVIQEHRQVFFKPYRVIYFIVGDSVYV